MDTCISLYCFHNPPEKSHYNPSKGIGEKEFNGNKENGKEDSSKYWQIHVKPVIDLTNQKRKILN